MLLYVIGYRRLVHRALETQDVPLAVVPGALRKLIVGRLVGPLSAARPVAGAARVRADQLRAEQASSVYGIYIGVGCAIVVAGSARGGLGPRGAEFLSPSILSIALVITFLGAGRASTVRDPDRPVRELGVPHDRAIVDAIHVAGARLALLLIAAAPPIALLLPAYAMFWGPAVAAAHAATS